MLKVATTLVYEHQAEEAARFYASVFPNSRIVSVRRRPDAAGNDGAVVSVAFELEGQRFMALNVGTALRSWQGASLFVGCDLQEEVDALWERLSDGGERRPAGWVTDRFGVSWQVVPHAVGELLNDDDPATERVLAAIGQMTKIEIDRVRAAYEAA